MFCANVARQNVPALEYNLALLAGVGAVGEVRPVLLEPVDQGSLGMLCIMVAKAVGGGEELALLPALGALHVGHLKVPLIEAQGLGAKFVFSF